MLTGTNAQRSKLKKYGIFSIGVDIEKISRFEKIIKEKNEKFLKDVYTDKEIDICFARSNPAECLAGRFCAKEAIKKAFFKLGLKKISMKEVEILKDEEGLPVINLTASKINFKYNIELSISHCPDTAIAYTHVLVNQDENI